MPIEATRRTVADVIYQVTRTFGDEANVQINNKDIIEWIKRAQIEVVLNNRDINRTSVEIPVAAGAKEVDLTSFDILRVHGLVAGNILLKNIPFEEALQNITGNQGNIPTGSPKCWYEFDNKVKFLPIPTEDFVLTVYYNRLPQDVTSPENLLDVPDAFFPAIVDWVLRYAYELDEDVAKAQMKSEDIQRNIANNQIDTRVQELSYEVVRDVWE